MLLRSLSTFAVQMTVDKLFNAKGCISLQNGGNVGYSVPPLGV